MTPVNEMPLKKEHLDSYVSNYAILCFWFQVKFVEPGNVYMNSDFAFLCSTLGKPSLRLFSLINCQALFEDKSFSN